MKKILSLVLAALMVFSMVPAIFAEEVADTTAAVEEVSEYQAAIDFLKLLGIYVGTSEDSFVAAAKEPVNRAQMALFTSRFITGQVDPAYWMTSENDSGFTDVDDLYEEAIGAISFASQKGIVNGVGEGLFDPETGVQYREAITMIVRALGYTYKASGYPWSYINKAREIGLLDGIANIGYTEQINREVVAQLLFNALFVEQDGSNVAESVFNVGATVVMITASNKVTYADDTVARANYVRFQELDANTLEPTGAKYHVSYDKFGLADGKEAANAAVGTVYAITYKNGCADVLAYECLTETYENRGAETTKFASGKLTIAGSTLTAVKEYSYLHKDQGTYKGADEVKLFLSTGKVVSTGYNTSYIVTANGVINKVEDGKLVPYAYYSAILDCYYTLSGDKATLLSDADVEKLLTASGTATGAFNRVDAYETKLAYADFYATDANLDDVIDRVVMRKYTLGQISFADKQKKGSDSGKGKAATFQIAYDTYADANDKSTLTLSGKAVKEDYTTDTYGMGAASQSGKPFVDEFRWTGIQKADIANNSWVLFYVDEANKEIDILKVVDTDAADGTYTVKGYLRGYNAATDEIYMGTEYTKYSIGYDTLAGSPLKTKAVKDNQAVNVSLIQGKINTYVELVIVDNKVVYIKTVDPSANYVIIDSFVGFEEDGILVNAWTTVGTAGEYTQIKIAEYNGWNVGGYEYDLLFLATWLGDSAFAKLPVKTNTLYKVVYAANGVYNLTDCGAAKQADTNLAVNAYGYIEGVNTKGELAAANYAATTDKDYWLILVKDADTATAGEQPKVIALAGKAQTGVSVTGDIYKSTENDYVFVADTLADLSDLDILAGTAYKYVMYNAAINNIENQFMFNPNTAYSWFLLMQNVKTGGTETVYIDPALVKGWNGTKLYEELGFAQGNIYKVVVDANGVNVLTSTTVYSLAPVADLYANKDGFGKVNTATVTGGDIQNVYNEIAKAYVKDAYGEWIETNATYATLVASFAKKDYITVYGINSSNALKSNDKSIVADANTDYTVEFIFNKDGKAFAWVVNADKFVSTGTVTPAKYAVVEAGVETPVVDDYKPTIGWSFNEKTGKLTVTYTAGTNKVAFDAATSSVKFSVAGVVTTVDAANIVVDGGLASFTQTIDATAEPADVDVTVVVDGTTEVIFW